ncbi:MAG: helix-turn-helix transcriptional regulator [Clostridia bacterium]|nr:helix-turn-helix transcriptional regulator [Clostridia bacterium]
MKSKEFKLLTTEDGKQYRFVSAKLKYLIKELSDKQKSSQKKIMEEIAERTNYSYEAVKNWANGYNGPSSMEVIDEIANVLNVDRRKLLNPIAKEEATTMTSNITYNDKEKELIEYAYIHLLSELLSMYDNLSEEAYIDKGTMNWNPSSKELLSNYVSLNSLFVSDEIISVLLKLIDDVDLLGDPMCFYCPYEWDDFLVDCSPYCMSMQEWGDLFRWLPLYDREEAIETFGFKYLAKEIEFCKRMRLAYTDIPEEIRTHLNEYDDNKISATDIGKYGIYDDYLDCHDITREVTLFYIRNTIKAVFVHYFPGLIN